MKTYASVAGRPTSSSSSSSSISINGNISAGGLGGFVDDEGGRHGGFSESNADLVRKEQQEEREDSNEAETQEETREDAVGSRKPAPQTATASAARPKTLRCRLTSPLAVLCCAPNKDRVVVGGKDVLKILNVVANDIREAVNLRAGMRALLNYSLTDVKWAPHFAEHTIASSYLNGDIILWDLTRGNQKQVVTMKDHDQSVNRLSFHRTEPILLLSACQDATVKLWDLRDKAFAASATFEGRADKVRDVQFSPTSPHEFLCAFENGDVQKWDLRKPNEPEKRWSAHFGLALTVDWHPDGKYFASAGRDKVIKFWDTKAEGRKPFQTIQTSSHVARIAWRPSEDGRPAHQIASCSLAVEHKLQVWDLGRGFVAEWAVEEHNAPITDFVWQDSDVVWSVSKDHTFVRQDLHVAGYHPSSLISPCALGWSQFGDCTFATPLISSTNSLTSPTLGSTTATEQRDSSKIRKPPDSIARHPSINLLNTVETTSSLPSIHSTTSTNRNSSSSTSAVSPHLQSVIPSPHPGPIQQLSAIFETEGLNHTAFIVLAFKYNMGKSARGEFVKPSCDEIWEMCAHNSEQAADQGYPRAAQTWKFIQLLFGMPEATPYHHHQQQQLFKKSANNSNANLPSTSANASSSTIHSPTLLQTPSTASTLPLPSTQQHQQHQLVGLHLLSHPRQPPPPLAGVDHPEFNADSETYSDAGLDSDSDDDEDNVRFNHVALKASKRGLLGAVTARDIAVGGGGAQQRQQQQQQQQRYSGAAWFRRGPLVAGVSAALSSATGTMAVVPQVDTFDGFGGSGVGDTGGALSLTTEGSTDESSGDESGRASLPSAGRLGLNTLEKMRQQQQKQQQNVVDGADFGWQRHALAAAAAAIPDFDAPVKISPALSPPIPTTVTTASAAVAAEESQKWVFDGLGLSVPQLDREDLVHDILKFYGDRGNSQMCCTILMVLHGHLKKVDPGMKELWMSSYIDLLHRFQCWTTAAHVISNSGVSSIESRNQESTTVHSACGACSKPIPNAPHPGWVCERCLGVTSVCVLCHKPVKSAYTWCHGCQHGGHLECMEQWYSKNNECASGCGHVCT